MARIRRQSTVFFIVNPTNEGLQMTRIQDRRLAKPLRTALAVATLALAGGLSLGVQASPAHHGGGSHGMMGGTRYVDRVLEQVQASPEQRSQVLAIVTAARADLQAQRGTGPALHLEMAKLLAQPSVDARAVEVLRQQMLAQHAQSSRRWTQAMLDISRVLTPEQRQQLAERMSQRHAMRQRHHAEREAASGGSAPAR